MSYPNESPFGQQPSGGSGQSGQSGGDASEIQTVSFQDSGNLRSAAYDPTNGNLIVTFSDGSRYKYADIEPTLFEDFSIANESRIGSFGKFFSRYIKPRGGTKLGGD